MNTENDRNELRDLLGAWAVDAVDDVERARIERAIAADSEFAREAEQMRQTVAAIAQADAADPPAELRARVLDEARNVPQVARHRTRAAGAGRAQGASGRVGPDRKVRRRILAAVAAAVVAVAIPTSVAIQQSQRADHAEEHVAVLEEALRQDDAQLVTADVTGGGQATAVIGADQAVFLAQDMPNLDDGDYQLWIVTDEATSAGVLTWEDGRLLGEVPQFPADAALAITAEPEGGSDQPTTEPLVVLVGSADS